jgi:hypothetical protein
MPKFKLGERVRRELVEAAGYVQIGTIVGIIPNEHQLQIFDQYEVDFGSNGVLIAYETQLQAA